MSSLMSNLLLNALASHERAALQQHLQQVPIPAGAVLFEGGRRSRYVYMLTSGLASIGSEIRTGSGVEVGLVGREGIPGSCRLLDRQGGMTRCVMREAGTALRMEYVKFEHAFQTLPSLHRRVLQHVQHQARMTELTCACNCVHTAEERLARWLLMASDRVGDVLVNATQEVLSQILGTRRTTITFVAGAMQERSLVRYRRGRLQIVDRQGLQELACECYPLTRLGLNQLYSGPIAMASQETVPRDQLYKANALDVLAMPPAL